MPSFHIRSATRADVASLVRLVRGLAEYERLAHLVESSAADFERALFGEGAGSIEALLLWSSDEPVGEPVGFALFFHNFSTFLGRRGLYLEDLFVAPEHRGHGYGRALLAHLARLAVDRECGRFEWAVLDWNVDAQAFYEKLGAVVMPDWRITRMTGDALVALANQSDPT
jgi:GNAT superfamily N-acetyltransferase